MADTMSRRARSELMAKIRGDNLRPERLLARAIPKAKRNVNLPGRPDLLVGRLAVFVHGCFWHCCPEHFRLLRARRAEWRKKFRRNVARDRRVRRQLSMGYRTTVVWEHDLKTEGQAARVAARLAKRGRKLLCSR